MPCTTESVLFMLDKKRPFVTSKHASHEEAVITTYKHLQNLEETHIATILQYNY